MKLTLARRTNPEPGVATFILEPDAPLAWEAGQFLHYTLPHPHPDDRGAERWFTIASAPFEKHVQITTRHSDKGSTFKTALFGLPVGSEIDADGLEGDFTAPEPEREMILVAGGIGITPFRSILLDLDHRGLPIRAKLLYANRDDAFIFKDELEALAAKHPEFSIRYFSNGARIDEAAIRAAAPDLTAPLYYVSGPEPMVEAFEKMLIGMGIPDAQVKRDYFPGYDA